MATNTPKDKDVKLEEKAQTAENKPAETDADKAKLEAPMPETANTQETAPPPVKKPVEEAKEAAPKTAKTEEDERPPRELPEEAKQMAKAIGGEIVNALQTAAPIAVDPNAGKKLDETVAGGRFRKRGRLINAFGKKPNKPEQED